MTDERTLRTADGRRGLRRRLGDPDGTRRRLLRGAGRHRSSRPGPSPFAGGPRARDRGPRRDARRGRQQPRRAGGAGLGRGSRDGLCGASTCTTARWSKRASAARSMRRCPRSASAARSRSRRRPSRGRSPSCSPRARRRRSSTIDAELNAPALHQDRGGDRAPALVRAPDRPRPGRAASRGARPGRTELELWADVRLAMEAEEGAARPDVSATSRRGSTTTARHQRLARPTA